MPRRVLQGRVTSDKRDKTITVVVERRVLHPVYKKIIKLKPDHEHALMQAAELVAGQGLFADARAYLNTVVETRRAAGAPRRSESA